MPGRRARSSTCFAATAAAHPEEPALDDGTVLTYVEPASREVDALAARLVHAGVGRGRPGRRPHAVGHATTSTSRSSPCSTPAPPTCRSTPTTRQERADLVFGEAGVALVLTDGTDARRAGTRPVGHRPDPERSTTTPGSSSPPAPPAFPRASPSPIGPPRRSSTPRPSCSCADEPLGPDDRVLAGLSVAFDASLRGDVAGLAARRLPGAGAPRAGAHGHGPRAVAGRAGHHRRVHRAHPRRRCGPPTRSTRCGSSSSAARPVRRAWSSASWTRAARCGTPTGRPRRPSSPAPRRWRPTGRCASGCRWPAGTWPSSTPAACRCRRARSAS